MCTYMTKLAIFLLKRLLEVLLRLVLRVVCKSRTRKLFYQIHLVNNKFCTPVHEPTLWSIYKIIGCEWGLWIPDKFSIYCLIVEVCTTTFMSQTLFYNLLTTIWNTVPNTRFGYSMIPWFTGRKWHIIRVSKSLGPLVLDRPGQHINRLVKIFWLHSSLKLPIKPGNPYPCPSDHRRSATYLFSANFPATLGFHLFDFSFIFYILVIQFGMLSNLKTLLITKIYVIKLKLTDGYSNLTNEPMCAIVVLKIELWKIGLICEFEKAETLCVWPCVYVWMMC